jgi:hypothetical protein
MTRILLVADVAGWSFDTAAQAMQEYLPYEIDIKYVLRDGIVQDFTTHDRYDLIFHFHQRNLHLYELSRYVEQQKQLGTKLVVGVNHIMSVTDIIEDIPLFSQFDRVWSFNSSTSNLRRCGLLVDTLYNPIDSTTFRVTKEKTKEFKVCFVASKCRLEWKGYNIWQEVQRLLESLPIQFVECIADSYKNVRSHQEMADIYNDCSLYLCLSRSEGTPMPLLESAACGCATISTECGGYASILDGTLMIPRTAEAAATAIVKLWRDRNELESRQAAVFGSVQKFFWCNVIDQYCEAIRGALA